MIFEWLFDCLFELFFQWLFEGLSYVFSNLIFDPDIGGRKRWL
jgi:hypothetical protein